MPLTLIRQPSSPTLSSIVPGANSPRSAQAPHASPPTTRAAGEEHETPRETAEPDTSAILPSLAMSMPAAKWIAGFAPSRRAALARAQSAWLTRQVTLDPRLALYSSQITADELYHAMRVFRSLFDRASSAQVSVRAALDWASVLVDAADAAEEADTVSPLPYLWMPAEELDAAEAERREPSGRLRRRLFSRGGADAK